VTTREQLPVTVTVTVTVTDFSKILATVTARDRDRDNRESRWSRWPYSRDTQCSKPHSLKIREKRICVSVILFED